jgi:hypothetical protein
VATLGHPTLRRTSDQLRVFDFHGDFALFKDSSPDSVPQSDAASTAGVAFRRQRVYGPSHQQLLPASSLRQLRVSTWTLRIVD